MNPTTTTTATGIYRTDYCTQQALEDLFEVKLDPELVRDYTSALEEELDKVAPEYAVEFYETFALSKLPLDQDFWILVQEIGEELLPQFF